MPFGGDPPQTGMPQGVFNTIHGYGYNATSQTFVDANNNPVYLGVEGTLNGAGQWFCGSLTDMRNNPAALIPQLTATVIQNGTWANGKVSYNNSTYSIRFERDPQTAKDIAKANVG